MSIVDLPGQSGPSGQSSPPFSLSLASHRSPAPSLATGERVGTRADYAALSRHAVADLCDSLGCPCAGIVARIATTPEHWRAVAKTVRGMASRDMRLHDQQACGRAADALAAGDSIAAAIVLARVTGEDLTEWHTRVTGEMVSAKAQGSVTL